MPSAAGVTPSTWTDAFTGTAATNLSSHALDTGQAWAYSADGASDTTLLLDGGGSAVPAAAGEAVLIVTTPAPTANQDVSLQVFIHDTSDSPSVILRGNNDASLLTSDYYAAYVEFDSGQWRFLIARVADFPTYMYRGIITGTLLAIDGLSTIRLVANGNALDGYFNGFLQASVTDSVLSAPGYVGFSVINTSAVMTVDNFSVTFT